MRRDHKNHIGSPCRSVFSLILISMSLIRFQESKRDLIGSSLLYKWETDSGYNHNKSILALTTESYFGTNDRVLSLAIDI